MREFIGGRVMVAYPEPWMDRVDAMKTLQGWTDTNITHFRDLGVYGEQILLTIIAIPVGCAVGVGLCYLMNNLVDREILRLPLVFSLKTVISTGGIVIVATIVSSMIVARRLRNLDLIEVLKTRE